MRPPLPLLLALACLLGAAGCGTTRPAKFFQLNAPPIPPAAGAPGWSVRAVRLPRYLDRSQMVFRKKGHEVALDEYNRWAEPLEDGVARVLAAGRRNPGGEPWLVEVDVILLDVADTGAAVLEAAWSARPPRGGTPVSGLFRKTRSASGPGPESGTAALSALVVELGNAITEAIGREVGARPSRST